MRTVTSALLEVACCGLSHENQVKVFKGMSDLAPQGRIAVERHVFKECSGVYFDLPAGWVSFVSTRLVHPVEAMAPFIGRVMAVAGNVIEQNALNDPADPYVLALALQLQADGHNVCVVTEDRRDRLPKKISMATAADRLGLPWCDLQAFLRALNLP